MLANLVSSHTTVQYYFFFIESKDQEMMFWHNPN